MIFYCCNKQWRHRKRHRWHQGEFYLRFVTCCVTCVTYGRPSPPKIQGCQIDQQIQRWSKDQLQDRIANKGMAWTKYRRFSFPS